MTMILGDVFGSPNIGVYCFCNEELAIVPPGLTSRKLDQFAEALGVRICKTTVGGSTLVGALVAGNSRGLLVPHIVREYELDRIKEFSRVVVVDSRWTAFGNIVLANDFGAAIHQDAPEEIVQSISEELDVDPVPANIGEIPFVGALSIATNRGAIISPNAHEDDLSTLQSALHVRAEISTINGGVPFVRSGILANSKGAIAGSLTRGAELMQIQRALFGD